ncbi:MAG: type II toxin-antitoxin system PemK/MazF family toxin [Deltaproteobacteria bacterium]|nr:type II toxin-antitoxin system PemK/MazF family toxin [Deltaproteobacteria bacterium]PJB33794.1 MAG: type II toxin-antitoxin system PemK/MazF family toxin [Deltaproteobacteria bacterium CG_4_9_14_3_um_filter_51_14]
MKVGELYWVNLDPTIGDEIKKRRPVVVLNGGHDKHLKLAIVIPVTEWSPIWEKNPFFVSLDSNTKTGLNKKSAVDCFQIRAVSHNRFAEKIGEISDDDTARIKKSITLILDIEPQHCEM